jgi:RHS repeat-associated protein
MSVTNHTSATIYAKDGTQVYPSVKDTNGNYFGKDGNGNPIDTLGRTPVTASTQGSTTTYSVLNSQGSTSDITVTTTTVNYHTNFGQSGVTDVSGSFTAISSIALPNGTSYGFTYDSGTGAGNFGLIKRITLPAGGTVDYTYTTFADAYGNKNRWVSTRTPSPGGQWSYAPAVVSNCSQGTCQQQVTVTKPSPQSDVAVHTFSLNNGAWNSRTDFYTGSSALQMTLLTTYDFSNNCPPNTCVGARYIRATENTTQVPSVGSATLTKKIVYQYDDPALANIKEIDEWQWTTGNPGQSPDRKTLIAYQNSQSYKDRNIINRPSSTTVTDGSGNWLSETDIKYDTATPNPISGIVHWSDPGTNVRGNPTKIQRLLSSGATCPSATGCLETILTYDGTGQVVGVKDPNNHSTSMSYSDNFYTDNGANPPAAYTPTQGTNAYLTQITPPLIGSASIGYYFGSGKPAVATDQNGAASYQHYLDGLDRLTHSYGPLVNGARGWQLRQYPSGSATEVDAYTGVTETTASTSCSSCRKDVTTLDGLGRLLQSKILNDPDGTTKVDTAYDTSGRVLSVSNPYRSAGNGSDSFAYDGINRTTSVTHSADNNSQVAYYGAAAGSNGGLSSQQCTGYGTGLPSLFVDEAGRKRQVWTDGFGRTIEADEPNPGTGSLTTNGTTTCYTYDLLSNLKQVDQGDQARKFSYDGLSRVTQVISPEANNGSTYIYYTDASGNLCSGNPSAVCRRKDARNVTTTYTYDALNRLTAKVYSDSTASVTYSYDQTSCNSLTIANGKGRRTCMSDGSGQTAWSYDAAGRFVTEKRTISNTTKTSEYSYTVGGQLASIKFPYATSPDRNVVYTYSNIGRPTQATDTINNNIDYVKNATYAPQGDLATYVAGNTGGFAGINVNNQFNQRLQPFNFSASYQSNTIFSESYSFVDANSKNNGNLMQMQNGLDSTRNQTYTYDYLNRLLTAQTAANSGQACWGQSFTYDRYGNLSTIAVTKCSAPTFSLVPSTTTNRFTDSGFQYDAAGNMTNDTSTAYTYDAENQMLTAGTSSMVYDGDGLRVKSNAKFRWRMPGGGMYLTTTDTSAGGINKDMIYFAGQQVAQRVVNSGAVSYYFSDQVGSVRMMVDATATTCWDADYYPFGGSNIFTYTNCQPQYRYTLMETEPSMSADDDYAMFRYYSHRFARFMSPDPIGGDPSNPQSWNRYAYAMNAPCTSLDPWGLVGCTFKVAVTGVNNQTTSQEWGDAWAEFSRILGTGQVGAELTSSDADFTLNLKHNPTSLLGAIAYGVGALVPEGFSLLGDNDTSFSDWFSGRVSNAASVWVNNVEMAAAGMNMGTALGRVMSHEFMHWATQVPHNNLQRSPSEEGILTPGFDSMVMNGLATITPKQAPIVQKLCNKHRRGGPGSGGGGGGFWIVTPIYAPVVDEGTVIGYYQWGWSWTYMGPHKK